MAPSTPKKPEAKPEKKLTIKRARAVRVDLGTYDVIVDTYEAIPTSSEVVAKGVSHASAVDRARLVSIEQFGKSGLKGTGLE